MASVFPEDTIPAPKPHNCKRCYNKSLHIRKNWISEHSKPGASGQQSKTNDFHSDIQNLRGDIEGQKGDFDQLDSKIQAFNDQYHNPETGGLVKDMGSLAKKYEALLEKAEKVRKLGYYTE